MSSTVDSMEDHPDFASWFRERLRQREWTQADFARRMGLSTGTVSNWASGRRVPDPNSCDLIADVLGADLDVVLTLAGHRPVDRPLNLDDPRVILHALVDRVDWSKDNRARIIEGILRQFGEDDRRDAQAPESTAPAGAQAMP